MGWFTTFRSLFSRREKVSLANALPGKLEIIPHASFSDQRIIPGLPRNPDINKKVVSRGLTYFNTLGGSREWVPPQYDHLEVEILFDIESYFARATRAKLALFLKEGFEFVGKNDDRVEYIRARIRQIERASSVPFEETLLSTCRDLLVHSNAYWLKVRKLDASGGKIRSIDNRKLKPVAGYFRLPPETMVPEIDTSGNIVRWKQSIGGEERIFPKNDIVHFYTNKKAGYPLGVPSIIPAIDDIRALRSLEHNIDVLIHKHLFPIILWKVGTDKRPADTFSDGTTEIEVVQNAVANMPTEGSLVVSERYDVRAIGAENKALRVDAYLQHLKERLLAGLDVSSIDVGVGNAASRSTAQTLSRMVVDTVKLHQILIERFFQPVIEELLLESTFSAETILNQDNIVNLNFHEIDKEAQQAKANHLTDLYHKNMLTFPETRIGIDTEVLTPEEEKELYWYKLGKEQALTTPVNESLGAGGSVSNNNRPKNQQGTRASAKLNKDEFQTSKQQSINPILAWHKAISEELQARWGISNLKMSIAVSDIKTSYNVALDEFIPMLHSRIRRNYPDPEKVHGLNKYADTRARRFVTKLRDDVIRNLKANPELSPDIIFSAFAYRAVLIFDTELAFAENVSRYRWYARNKLDMNIISSSEEPCELCKPKLTLVRWNDKLGEANIPPFHPLCNCRVVAVEGQF